MFYIEQWQVIILACIAAYYFSYYYLSKEKVSLSILLILLAAVIIRIYLAADQFLNPWDESFHALVAKNIMNHPFKPTLMDNPVMPYSLTKWEETHIWLHKQPLSLWIMGCSIRLFGVNEWAVRIPSIIMNLTTIFWVFKIGKILFNQRVGWWAAFLFSVIPFPAMITAGILVTDHVDVCYLFFITGGIYVGLVAVHRNSLAWASLTGVLMGMAILTKWLPALIILGLVGICLIYKRGIKFLRKILFLLLILGIAVLIFLPWQIYIFNAFPVEAKFEYNYNIKHIYEAVEGHSENTWFNFDVLVINWSLLCYFFIAAFIYFVFKERLNWKGLMLLIWLIVPMIFFTIVKTKMPCYALFTYPAMAIIFGYVIDKFMRPDSKTKVISGFFVFITILIISLQSIDTMKLNIKKFRKKQWSEQLKTMAKEKRTKPLVLFNSREYIQAMFYIDNCTAYVYSPDSLTIQAVKLKGYDVMVFDGNTQTYVLQ